MTFSTSFSKTTFSISLAAILFIVSCKKENTPAEPASRLYVSAADTDPAVANLFLYDPADVTSPTITATINNNAKDGNGVIVTGNDQLFQLSRQNKTVHFYTTASALNNSSVAARTFTDATLTSGRELAYDNQRDILYIANNTDSSIRMYSNASTLSGNVTGKKFKIAGQPWGIFYDAAGNNLLVLMDLAAMRIDIFSNPSGLAEGIVTASRTLNITNRPNGALSRLHGITYSASSDMLLVTEIGEAAAPSVPNLTKPAFNADGGIYIIKGAAAKIAAGGNVTADAVIYGSNTMLGNPVDIAIDDRNAKGIIYVAEKANKRILAFKVTDANNASPTINVSTTYSPEAIDLFVR